MSELAPAVDVLTEIEIERPRAEVAGYAANPDNAPEWYENIEAVDWKTERALAAGARVAFVARFLGRRLAYTYEVETFVPGERLVMATNEGPFPMETTYAWTDTASGGTRMTLRNRGRPNRVRQDQRAHHGRCDPPGQPQGPRAAQADRGISAPIAPDARIVLAWHAT